ncbi:hypothetical protein [Tautonia sociabilis]|uniref:Recombination-associated protein RdgC n=1 Tax=Tautonia sociabilis TaxID=2080755 RepID=A0A432MNQ0_9BACT|nr:hypothetical protein [Tautonia sociabilis]RUL88807.1 hypothetical protein TsocGM_05470 [Tautonia sociabilis]
MGFLNGRVSYMRFRVGGESPLPIDEELLEKVSAHAIGRHGDADPTDGVHFGWSGGNHVLDMTFDLGKNLVNDALHLGLRIDADKIPGDLLKAYTQIELDARAAQNPSGRPTKAQREEAKEAAKVRAEAEAADGRYRRRKMHPILWDCRTNILYAGSASNAVLDRLLPLFRDTFDRSLEPLTAGALASSIAAELGRDDALSDSAPLALFGDGESALYSSIAWAEADPTSKDYWGNEFLLWLWYTLQYEGDVLTLADGSECSVMISKTLQLDCPRGETGRDSLSNEGPTRLPEALRALQSGKLPRKAGLLIERQGSTYDLTIQAESMAVSGASLPKEDGVSGREAHEGRIDYLRHLTETLDLLYGSYVRRRLDPSWNGELGRIRDWLRAA